MDSITTAAAIIAIIFAAVLAWLVALRGIMLGLDVVLAVLAIGSTVIFAMAVALMNSWSFSAQFLREEAERAGTVYVYQQTPKPVVPLKV